MVMSQDNVHVCVVPRLQAERVAIVWNLLQELLNLNNSLSLLCKAQLSVLTQHSDRMEECVKQFVGMRSVSQVAQHGK